MSAQFTKPMEGKRSPSMHIVPMICPAAYSAALLFEARFVLGYVSFGTGSYEKNHLLSNFFPLFLIITPTFS